jgi:hypothetical protein
MPNGDDPDEDTLDSKYRNLVDSRWFESVASVRLDLAGQLPLLGDDQQALRWHQHGRRNRLVELNRSALVMSVRI